MAIVDKRFSTGEVRDTITSWTDGTINRLLMTDTFGSRQGDPFLTRRRSRFVSDNDDFLFRKGNNQVEITY